MREQVKFVWLPLFLPQQCLSSMCVSQAPSPTSQYSPMPALGPLMPFPLQVPLPPVQCPPILSHPGRIRDMVFDFELTLLPYGFNSLDQTNVYRSSVYLWVLLRLYQKCFCWAPQAITSVKRIILLPLIPLPFIPGFWFYPPHRVSARKCSWTGHSALLALWTISSLHGALTHLLTQLEGSRRASQTLQLVSTLP